MDEPLAVLVTGATGRQGGAVARALVAHGHQVRALTRSPEGAPAVALVHLGVDLWPGNFDDDPTTLANAMDGVTAVFAMGTPSRSEADAERRQGCAVIDAAVRADVQHLIYSSAAGADWPRGPDALDSKFQVEIHLRAAALANTIVAPTFFMENFLKSPWSKQLRRGRLELALAPRVQLEMVSAPDLGAFVVKLFEERDPFLSKRIVVTSDVLTGVEVGQVLSHAVALPILLEQVPLARAGDDDAKRLLRWLARPDARLTIADLHEAHPAIDWTPFSAWAAAQAWPKGPSG